jgi:hypothetical protein
MPGARPALVKAKRPAGPVERIELTRTACDRCGSAVYALPEGGPRPHLRSTTPSDPGHSEIVPTMTDCLPDDEGTPADCAFDQAPFHQ